MKQKLNINNLVESISDMALEQKEEDTEKFASVDGKGKKLIKFLQRYIKLNPVDPEVERFANAVRIASTYINKEGMFMARKDRMAFEELVGDAQDKSLIARLPETIIKDYKFLLNYSKKNSNTVSDNANGFQDVPVPEYAYSEEVRKKFRKKAEDSIKRINEEFRIYDMSQEDQNTIKDTIQATQKAFPKDDSEKKIERKTRTPQEKAKFATTMISLVVLMVQNVPYFFPTTHPPKDFDEKSKAAYTKLNNRYINVIQEYELDKEWEAINQRLKDNDDVVSRPAAELPQRERDIKTLLGFANVLFDHLDHEDKLRRFVPGDNNNDDDVPNLGSYPDLEQGEVPAGFDNVFKYKSISDDDERNLQDEYGLRKQIVGIKDPSKLSVLREKIYYLFFETEVEDLGQVTPQNQQTESLQRLLIKRIIEHLKK